MQLQRNQAVVTGKTMVRTDFTLQTVSQFRSSQRRNVSLVRIVLRCKGHGPLSCFLPLSHFLHARNIPSILIIIGLLISLATTVCVVDSTGKFIT